MTELKKELGGELELEVRLEGAEAILEIKHEGNLGSIKLEGKINAALLIDKITDIIPGEWDDALIDGMAAKMLAKKSA